MGLTKKKAVDIDPCQEVILRCPISDQEHLYNFLRTEYCEKYKFSTIPQAHQATQAVLERMVTDLDKTVDTKA